MDLALKRLEVPGSGEVLRDGGGRVGTSSCRQGIGEVWDGERSRVDQEGDKDWTAKKD